MGRARGKSEALIELNDNDLRLFSLSTASSLKPAIREARKHTRKTIHFEEDETAGKPQKGLTAGIPEIKIQDEETSRSSLAAQSSKDSRKEKRTKSIDSSNLGQEALQKRGSFDRYNRAMQRENVKLVGGRTA